MCREPPPGHVFVGSLAEIDPRKALGRIGASFTSHKIVTILGDPIGYRIADNKCSMRSLPPQVISIHQRAPQ